ncbi:MAG TPA: hypothetical protein V6D10_19065 [Trichocoleus sp.]|jgi:hypothetical protein
MVISKELPIDLNVLKSVLAEGDSAGVSTYIDTETGEVLLARDMLEEEIKDRQRLLKVPSKKLCSISTQTIEMWIGKTLEVIDQNYGENFMLQVKPQLEQAVKQTNYEEAVTTALIDLQGKGLDDNYFASWLEFVEKEEVSNIRGWLSAKGIRLVN